MRFVPVVWTNALQKKLPEVDVNNFGWMSVGSALKPKWTNLEEASKACTTLQKHVQPFKNVVVKGIAPAANVRVKRKIFCAQIYVLAVMINARVDADNDVFI